MKTTNIFYKVLCLMMMALCSVCGFAQISDVPSLPELATPSPKATMMDRFGYYPTNLYTGLIDITVPNYTIDAAGVQIPIEFKYHASGLKYDDLPMELGYGWTLMAGGTVSYQARGVGLYPPTGTGIYSPFLKEYSDVALDDRTGSIDSDQLQLEYIINGTKDSYTHVDYFRDSEYDVYNYSFLGHSVQAYMLYDGSNFTVPHTPLRLSPGHIPMAWDEQGNQYTFRTTEYDDCKRNITFYLTEIVSADKADTVKFEYNIQAWLSEHSLHVR